MRKKATPKKVMPKKEPKVESKKIEYHISEEDIAIIDNFFGSSLQAHSQGVLDYRNAFLKTVDIVKKSIYRKEV